MCTPQELDHLRHEAVLLRRQGKSLRQIKETLALISNSTLNQVLRDEPPPPDRAGPGYAESRARDGGSPALLGRERPAGKPREQPSAPLPRRSSGS